jgi:hypothetical protein
MCIAAGLRWVRASWNEDVLNKSVKDEREVKHRGEVQTMSPKLEDLLRLLEDLKEAVAIVEFEAVLVCGKLSFKRADSAERKKSSTCWITLS